MKKIISLLFFCLLLISCSSDEIGGLPESELILGAWKPLRIVEVNKDGTSRTTKTYEGCEESDRWVFGNHQAFRFEEFAINDSGNCRPIFTTRSGTWDIFENNNVTIFYIFRSGGSNTLFPKVTFQDKNTMWLIFESEASEIDYSYSEFIRVE